MWLCLERVEEEEEEKNTARLWACASDCHMNAIKLNKGKHIIRCHDEWATNTRQMQFNQQLGAVSQAQLTEWAQSFCEDADV